MWYTKSIIEIRVSKRVTRLKNNALIVYMYTLFCRLDQCARTRAEDDVGADRWGVIFFACGFRYIEHRAPVTATFFLKTHTFATVEAYTIFFLTFLTILEDLYYNSPKNSYIISRGKKKCWAPAMNNQPRGLASKIHHEKYCKKTKKK